MEGKEGGDDPRGARGNLLNSVWSRVVDYVKRKFNERRARREKETPTERAERRTANATWFIGILTLVIAVVGAAQWYVLTGTLNETRSEQRPWLSFEKITIQSMDAKNGIVRANVNYDVSNVGHVPAMDVFLKGTIIRADAFFLFKDIETTKRFCLASLTQDAIAKKVFTRANSEITQDVIFPGKSDSLFGAITHPLAGRSNL